MKIKTSLLRPIIKEEFAKIIVEKARAALKEKSGEVVDAQSDDAKDGKSKEDPKKKVPAPKKEAEPKKETPPKKEPEEDKSGEEEEDDEKEEAKSKISEELVGKTVQSISSEPKSKIMPGAQEIVITFDQISDPLRILVTRSGKVAYYFKGLHNEL